MLPYSPNYREFALWPGLVLYSGCLQNTQCMASRVSNEYMFLDWVDISFLSPWRMWCHAHMWIHWKDSILAGSISYGGKETEFLQQETLRNLLWVLLYVFSGNSMCLMSPLPLATWNRSNGAVGAGRSLPSGLQNRNWQSVISQREREYGPFRGSKKEGASSQFTERKFAIKQQFLKSVCDMLFWESISLKCLMYIILHTFFHIQYDRGKICKI